jgi:chromosome segregation ATPase
MNRFVQCVNFLGVVALAVLCGSQWRSNRLANLQIGDLERTRMEQAAQIAERDKTIKRYAADLDEFRQRLTICETALKETEGKLSRMTAERDQLTAERNRLVAERDRLKATLDTWVAAVATRDAALKEASARLQQIARERNDAIARFNDLAGKYNEIVKRQNNAPSTRPTTQP